MGARHGLVADVGYYQQLPNGALPKSYQQLQQGRVLPPHRQDTYTWDLCGLRCLTTLLQKLRVVSSYYASKIRIKWVFVLSLVKGIIDVADGS